MTFETRLWIWALVCLAAMFALGSVVAPRPPGRIDTAVEKALRGRAVWPALFFTRIGRWRELSLLGVLAYGVAITLNERVTPVLMLFATQVLSQATSSLCKLFFHRPRPAVYVGVREPEFSYPSGHAVTAVVFYGGFALLVLFGPFPRPVQAVIAALLGLCVVAIPWSRIALGAHFLSDICGGLLLGSAWLLTLIALYVQFRLYAAA